MRGWYGDMIRLMNSMSRAHCYTSWAIKQTSDQKQCGVGVMRWWVNYSVHLLMVISAETVGMSGKANPMSRLSGYWIRTKCWHFHDGNSPVNQFVTSSSLISENHVGSQYWSLLLSLGSSNVHSQVSIGEGRLSPCIISIPATAALLFMNLMTADRLLKKEVDWQHRCFITGFCPEPWGFIQLPHLWKFTLTVMIHMDYKYLHSFAHSGGWPHTDFFTGCLFFLSSSCIL